MILNFIKLIIIIIIIGLLASVISFTEGRTNIDWLGWGINLETSHFLMILILFSLIIVFLDRVWRYLVLLPKIATSRRDNANREKVENKLVKAFLLSSHGEFKQAAKEARLISNQIKDKKLGSLIKEHSEALEKMNQTNTKNISSKYLQALSGDKNMAYIRYLVEMRLEVSKNKDIDKVYNYANEASKLEPNSEQVIKILFYSAIKLNKIQEALEVSKNPIIMNNFGEKKFKKILSDLYYLDGLNKLKNNKKAAEIAFSKSVEHFSGNILSVLNFVKLLKGITARSKSIKLLKNAFFISPNEKLLNEFIKINKLRTAGEKVSSAINLLKSEEISEKNICEVKIQIAKFCVKQKIWGEAKRILSDIDSKNLTCIAYELLADIANAQEKPNEVKDYLKKSAKAKRGFNYYCTKCGSNNDEWVLNCRNCGELSSVDWIEKPNQLEFNNKLLQYN